MKFLTLIIFFSSLSFGQIIPSNRHDFCSRFLNNNQITYLTKESLNLINFKNRGGLINGGVCWWHSRFQRNLIYLSMFKPNESVLSKEEYKKIIKTIRSGNQIVIIPGFSNVEDFSKELENEIQNELEKWQLYDGLVLGGWIEGIKGDIQVPPNELEESMNQLYAYFQNGQKIPYLKLQIKGITSHAWLVTDMLKTQSGYTLGIIDSNQPKMTLNYSYHFGDSSFNDPDWGSFVPYLRFTNEEKRISNYAKEFCGIKVLNNDNEDISYEEDLKNF